MSTSRESVGQLIVLEGTMGKGKEGVEGYHTSNRSTPEKSSLQRSAVFNTMASRSARTAVDSTLPP
jgi:hypothetical protein